MNTDSLFEMGNALAELGLDILPVKTAEKLWTVSVWKHDEFLRFGKFKYDTAEEAVDKTTLDIYNKIFGTNNKLL